MTGEIAVRAYITATGEDKLVPHRRCLSGAVLAQAAEPVDTRCQREARLVSERRICERRIVRRDVRRIADDEIETLAAEWLKPAAMAEVDRGELQFCRIGARDCQGCERHVGGSHLPVRALAGEC